MRYKKLPKHKGIYEDTTNGRLWCQKRVNKKLFSQYFDSLKEAQHWMKNFSPDSPLFSKLPIEDFSDINGKKSATIFEVWDLFKKNHLSSLETTSQELRLGCEVFLSPIMKNDIRNATPQLIGQLLIKKKEEYIASKKTKRTRFDNELKTLNKMFNWWRENYDASFYCPIMKHHYTQGIIRKTVKRNSTKMPEEVMLAFLKEIYRIGAEDNLFAMLAELQYLTTGRIQEPAGLTIDKVNLDSGLLLVDQAVAFTRKKENQNYLKTTKTTSIKVFKLRGRLKEIILILKNRGLIQTEFLCHFDGVKKLRPVKFLFHVNGNPVTYRQIQYRYNQALKNLGLYPQFTSTHFMRHASSNHVRKKFGLDHAQVAGDWSSSATAEMYSGTNDNYRDESVEYLESRVLSLAKSSNGF